MCCIFQPAIGCCAPKTLVEIYIFNGINNEKQKKDKKARKFAAKFSKKFVFLSLHQSAGRMFYSQKIRFHPFSMVKRRTPNNGRNKQQMWSPLIRRLLFNHLLLSVFQSSYIHTHSLNSFMHTTYYAPAPVPNPHQISLGLNQIELILLML